MRLYSYILRHDGGFAPNPFHGICTLACCKPVIRRMGRPGDLVVGLTPKGLGYRLAYAMTVSEVMPFSAYWEDQRFMVKRPRWSTGSRVDRVGDNCYEPIGPHAFRQHRSVHSNMDGSEDSGTKAWDLSGQKVLAANRYWYFGNDGLDLPPEFDFLVVGRGHRSQFSVEQIQRVTDFLNQIPLGVHGAPRDWPEEDHSWMSKGSPATKGCR